MKRRDRMHTYKHSTTGRRLSGLMLAAAVALAAVLLLPASAIAQTWAAVTVDSTGSVGWYNSLAFNGSGQPCISYLDYTNSNLKYASSTDGGATWTAVTVDSAGEVGWFNSLAFNGSGQPCISYLDATNGNLKYASSTDGGATWTRVPADSTGDVGWYTSLAFNGSGQPCISYYDYTNGNLKYASSTDGGATWTRVPADSTGDVGRYTSLAFNGSGQPCISYFDNTNQDLKYASSNDDGATWTPTAVDSAGDVGQYNSLAFNGSGQPCISYSDNTNQDLKYASSNDGGATWTPTAVDSAGDVGQYTSLAFNGSGQPCISYYDNTNQDLKYASSTDGGATWTKVTADSAGGVGWDTSLAFNGSGQPCISYLDYTNLDLKYASYEDTPSSHTWTPTTADNVGDVGLDTSLAFNGSGQPCISYLDATNQDLKYASSNDDGATWAAVTADSTGSVGGYTSLAFNGSGQPCISYYDYTNQDLKYASSTDGGATWTAVTVDSAGDVGRYTSLAFNGSGEPCISYYDLTNGDLKYASSTDGGANWTAVTVDIAGDVGWYTSLAFNGSGQPCISYYDYTNGDLKYGSSTDGGATWTKVTVDSAGIVGWYTSIAFNGPGQPCISYHDMTNGCLKYASSIDGGATWTKVTADNAGWVGGYTSLAFNGYGEPCISHYDYTNQDLKYASSTDGGATWAAVTADSAGDVGQYTSLAFNGYGEPCISYWDATNQDLKYASYVGNYLLNTSVSGNGTVTRVPDLPEYARNTTVQLTANPTGDATFVGWTGDLTGSTSPENIAVDGNKSVTAVFASLGTLTPNSANQGQTLDVDFAGTNTLWSDLLPGDVVMGAGITVNSIAPGATNTAFTASITVAGDAAATTRDVTVTAGGQTNTKTNAFTVKGVPTVTTTSTPSNITGTTATSGGNVTQDGGEPVTARGLCWSTSPKPTIADSHTVDGSGTGSFSSSITGLSPNTTYHVRAYATNSVGTSYGPDIAFTTLNPTAWYLAEGTNAWGFNTYISIENPQNEQVTARLTYMDPNPQSGAGVVGTRDVTLPPLSQTTVSSQPDIGNVDFSTKVECLQGKRIAVDRTMLWTGEGAPSPEGHSSIGTTTPSKTWHLPEGSSAWGFETWTLVQNPNAADAHVKLTYMTEAGTPKEFDRTVPARSRASYSMASDIGAADASVKVTSDLPVIAERSVYRNNRREGSCSIGATTPATDFFLAEGACGYDVGFTTWVLVQNPNDSEAEVTLTYQTQSGPKPQTPFTMGANSRKTVRVNDALPPNTNVSTTVHGSKPIIAERAMYWGEGTPLGEAMHASVGLDSAHMSFYLPDGQTENGWETWTLVANPNPGSVTVRITYLPQGGGTPVSFTDEIAANTRATYNMADKGISGRASIMVESLDGARPVIVERSMYWNNRGAGTDTIGGFSD